MKLLETVLIKGIIKVKTGLHIGAGRDNIEIGGLDLPVIKNPRTEQPYIPGSSLKGKIRFLTEWSTPDSLDRDGKVHSCKEADCAICRIFGAGKTGDAAEGRGPTRALVRDASLVLGEGEMYNPEKFMEVKYENVINRMTGTAEHPRPIERVVPDTRFAFEVAFRIFDTGDGGARDWECLKIFAEGMRRLEADTLGGSGSRGSGKVAFEDIGVNAAKLTRTGIATADELVNALQGAR